MPNPIYPYAWYRPGRNAGYASGRSNMRTTVCHYTVGRDSSGIGMDGYFHWLVGRDGSIQQYAEADAVTWHASEANTEGPGIEVEYYDEPEGIFTDAARNACGGLVRWLRDEWGFPADYYDGPRIQPGSHRGFQSHRSVQQTNGHSDFWPAEDFYAMVGPGAPGEDDDMKGLWIKREGGPDFVWLMYSGYKVACGGKGQVDVMAFMGMTYNGWDNVTVLAARDFDEIPILEWRDFPKGRYICGPPE